MGLSGLKCVKMNQFSNYKFTHFRTSLKLKNVRQPDPVFFSVILPNGSEANTFDNVHECICWLQLRNLTAWSVGNKTAHKNKVYRRNESLAKCRNLDPFTTLTKTERKIVYT